MTTLFWPSALPNNQTPQFDAIGSGDETASGSWTHDPASGAYVLAILYVYPVVAPAPQFGSTAMSLLGNHTDPEGIGFYFYGLSGVAAGSQTITYTTQTACAGNSISLTGVASVGSPTFQDQSSTESGSQTVDCSTGQIIVQSFEDGDFQAITSYSGGTGQYLGNRNNNPGQGNLTISTALVNTTFNVSLDTIDSFTGGYVILTG